MKKSIASLLLFFIAWSVVMALTANVPLLKKDSKEQNLYTGLKHKPGKKSITKNTATAQQ
ncbi:hypothetical protein GR160_09755 [Flavobacterium sp. Sd200]|uniref:hypothetical protein n=1 Tax=Flavobacterium sp. Sd200 TaxID=2692211 RepID=UPI00136C74E2|nr:hypothetical protein [Flavobacterium sp. Sd200]MXN91512.1 hypothetical protein [Flavobacterium sp. Sd200]